jgi:hypothetical protein
MFPNDVQIAAGTGGTVFYELVAEYRFPLFFVRQPSHAAHSPFVPLSKTGD